MSSDDGGGDRSQAHGSNADQVESDGCLIQLLPENQNATDIPADVLQETQEKVRTRFFILVFSIFKYATRLVSNMVKFY